MGARCPGQENSIPAANNSNNHWGRVVNRYLRPPSSAGTPLKSWILALFKVVAIPRYPALLLVTAIQGRHLSSILVQLCMAASVRVRPFQPLKGTISLLRQARYPVVSLSSHLFHSAHGHREELPRRPNAPTLDAPHRVSSSDLPSHRARWPILRPVLYTAAFLLIGLTAGGAVSLPLSQLFDYHNTCLLLLTPTDGSCLGLFGYFPISAPRAWNPGRSVLSLQSTHARLCPGSCPRASRPA